MTNKTNKTKMPPFVFPGLPLPGHRVGRVCGPGEFPTDDTGVVLVHAFDRWGQYAVIAMTDGGIERCHHLTKVGIGWYDLGTHTRA